MDLVDSIKSIRYNSFMDIEKTLHQAVFMASYVTEKYPDDEYLKIFFKDNTILEVIPGSQEFFFCDDPRRNIDRNLIIDDGERIKIDGKEFLSNGSEDKQYLKKIYFGNIEDGEGNCIFRDYEFKNEVWSLATLETGEKADVHVRKISAKDISLIQDKKESPEPTQSSVV